jgi:D-glycero-alpha-D-manno-heptose-7-phosphate kinase
MEAVTVRAPVRACDVGGWTDTWFAGSGRVCSLAVEPGVTVTADVIEGGSIEVVLPDLQARFDLDDPPPRHLLVAEAVREAAPLPGTGMRITVTAAVPPATSLGTSASVCVGVIAAIDACTRGAVRPPAELAAAAHRVEAVRLGRQSGVQDQVAAAHGGANDIEVDFPRAAVSPLAVEPAVRTALDEGLLHVAYGGPHDSSSVHEEVIVELEREGARSTRLELLRALAAAARGALLAGDLHAYGEVLTAATEAQRALHAGLVSADADALIAAAGAAGALGWKVNGAGGAGGSMSVLCPSARVRERLADVARALGHLPLELRLAARGAHVATDDP